MLSILSHLQLLSEFYAPIFRSADALDNHIYDLKQKNPNSKDQPSQDGRPLTNPEYVHAPDNPRGNTTPKTPKLFHMHKSARFVKKENENVYVNTRNAYDDVVLASKADRKSTPRQTKTATTPPSVPVPPPMYTNLGKEKRGTPPSVPIPPPMYTNLEKGKRGTTPKVPILPPSYTNLGKGKRGTHTHTTHM